MHIRLSDIALLFLAAAFVAAGAASCSKDDGFGNGSEENGLAVEFSAYTSGVATKGVSYDASTILGHWVDSTSTYVPGTGIGVFAFHQKAKSNGQPTYFNKNTGNPTFMYNQKLERTSSDGLTYSFEYSPKKYWPNNDNDLLSFFAYAPYDNTTAWEDLQLETDLKGTKISRKYVVEDKVSDQSDFMWADPVLNKKYSDVSGAIDFEFKHLCSRISVTAVANYDPDTPYLTVDSLSFIGRFYTWGTLEYDVASSTDKWRNLVRAEHDVTYSPFEEEYSYNVALGRDTSNAIRVSNVEKLAHPDDCYMFLLPGIQDITFRFALSQRNPSTGDVFTYSSQKLFPAMELEAGKAYNFRLNISIEPVSISSVSVVSIDLTDTPQYIP